MDLLDTAWSEYRRLKWLVADLKLDLLRSQFARKFDPNQARVPAGNPDGGQWTTVAESITESGRAYDAYAAGRKGSPAYCWNQMQIDMLLCSSLPLAWSRAVCRGQANERYAACLSGRPLPPLSY